MCVCVRNTNSISGVYYIFNDVPMSEIRSLSAVNFDRIGLTNLTLSTVFGLLANVERFTLLLYADKNIKATLNKQQRIILYKLNNEI